MTRTASGPHQPDPGDWPGYSMRGDEAIGLANELTLMAEAIERRDGTILSLTPAWLRRLAAKLETCRVKD